MPNNFKDYDIQLSPIAAVVALNLATGRVEWDTKVPTLALGAATVSNDLVFTTLYNGEPLALNRSTGAVVHEQKLPATTNSPIAITHNTILVPAGAPRRQPRAATAPRS